MLELVDLSKRYGDQVALDGCSFQVEPGRLTGFLGPNGAGKTTAMRCVMGLVTADRGQVLWQGLPIGPAERLRFGYMPEERGLYPRMGVREQLVYLGRLAGLERSAACRAADRWLARLGLASRATDRLERLSHGNQQRVQLAAALVGGPMLLVLDEPFAGLDPLAIDTLGGLLGELAAQGMTVLFSSHQLDLVEHLCQDVVVVHHGSVVLAGALEQLRAAARRRVIDLAIGDGAGAVPGWTPRLAGVQVAERGPGRLRLWADPGVDPAQVLAQARTHGTVTRLTWQPPSLSELFKEAVR
ncbi:MAG TPA: ATP-binding cassette domain-containing protein [Actinomycetes bacterium]|nr:ATP-binding cassette domain-containing protein [Actinomycetes bacterium]